LLNSKQIIVEYSTAKTCWLDFSIYLYWIKFKFSNLDNLIRGFLELFLVLLWFH